MKIDKATRARWEKYIRLYLAEHDHNVEDVTNLRQAWSIAHALDIPREAYRMDSSLNDTHIETVLKRIMPNIEEPKS